MLILYIYTHINTHIYVYAYGILYDTQALHPQIFSFPKLSLMIFKIDFLS